MSSTALRADCPLGAEARGLQHHPGADIEHASWGTAVESGDVCPLKPRFRRTPPVQVESRVLGLGEGFRAES